ncbi:alpha/beta hydrolase [Streptomyces winkii]|uniref:alpha/beta hydrolase n=1 Tax=Streptomyces winkii TaxID=3051178 RepID=UPI0028D4BE8E|nr:alpha/beta hydrolase [Streptomyces sp. DSM 40971]
MPLTPVRRAYGTAAFQYGDLYRAAGQDRSRDVIAVLHGGFWRPHRGLETTAPLCAYLSQRGMDVWNVEYRRVGQGVWSDTLHDCAAGVAHLDVLAEEFGLGLDRVHLVGHSAGGQLAVRTAARGGGTAARVRSVVSLAGVLDLGHAARMRVGDDAVSGFLGGPPEEFPERYASADPVACPVPRAKVWCVHSETDTRVPFEQSERYVEDARARGGDVRLVTVPGAHSDLIDPRSTAWRTAARHFDF